MTETWMEIDEEIEWWRPLVHWLLCIPHLVVNAVLSAVSIVVWAIGVPIVLVTGRLPRAFARFHVLVLRERARTFAFLFVLRRDLPPYGWQPDTRSTLDVTSPARVPRLAAITRVVTVLPHALVLLPVGACLDVLYPLWMVLVSANRGWPAGMARMLAGVERWVLAIILYATLVSDERPQWGLATNTAAATA